MMRRIGNALLIVALLAATGGHWAVLQSLAWTSMLTEHLQSQSFSEAVAQTFDGRHPCKLCLAIRAAKKSGKPAEFPQTLKKIEFPPLAANLVLFAPARFEWLNAANVFTESSVFPPPTPPPRHPPV
jgi:hypothetical protein